MAQVLEGRNGKPIGATDDGKLWVDATMHTKHNDAAVEGTAFFLPINGVSTNGAEHICVMKNTSTINMFITQIRLFVSTFKDSTRVLAQLNETFTYAAGGTVVDPTNLKSGIVGGAVGDFYTIASGGTDITTFGGTSVLAGIYVFTITPIAILDPGGWVVPPSQVFSLYNVGNDNTFYGGIDFYYHNDDNDGK